MEIRKIQLTGGSSYVITLPKDWVRSLNIKKNDSLGLITQPDGSLLVTTRTSEGRVHRTKEIRVEDMDDPTYLFRILIGTYIMGFSTIILRSSGRIQPFVRDVVMKFTQMTIGPEIMEESISSISIRDLLNPVEMPFDKTVKRMHILVRTMHEDAMSSLEKRERTLAEEVLKRDGDVNRLHWLTARQANMMLGDVTLSKKMGVTLEEANSYFLISRIIERLGDHAVHIAKNVLILIDQKMDRKLQSKIVAASATALGLVGNSLDTWFKRDILAAHQNIEALSKLLAQCEEINNEAQHIKSTCSIPVTDISESIRRVGEYATDISELVINNLVNTMK
jgi:phosphate uptake regulator